MFMLLIPKTCEYVTLYGKRDFGDVIKGKGLEVGDYFGLIGWTQSNNMNSTNSEWYDIRKAWSTAADFEDGKKGPGARECRWP